jgi:hypothetical protein
VDNIARFGKNRTYTIGFSRGDRISLGICVDDGFRKAKDGRVLCEDCLELRRVRQKIKYWQKKGIAA